MLARSGHASQSGLDLFRTGFRGPAPSEFEWCSLLGVAPQNNNKLERSPETVSLGSPVQQIQCNGAGMQGGVRQRSCYTDRVVRKGDSPGRHCQYHSFSNWQVVPLSQHRPGLAEFWPCEDDLPPHWPQRATSCETKGAGGAVSSCRGKIWRLVGRCNSTHMMPTAHWAAAPEASAGHIQYTIDSRGEAPRRPGARGCAWTATISVYGPDLGRRAGPQLIRGEM